MLYLYLGQNHIKLLYVKKTLLGQYESAFYEKQYSVDFLDKKGQVVNVDLLASAIKEATTSISPQGLKDKDVYLILPQTAFEFFRTEVPTDIAPSAIDSFVKDKARTNLSKDSENYLSDFLIDDNGKQKQIVFFALDKDMFGRYQEALLLVDLQAVNVIPDSLSYFKLFEKTLRREKKENILYVIYNKNQVISYLYDSSGPLDTNTWQTAISEKSSIEDVLKKKVNDYEESGKKINRIILSGENSDAVRQDTFTKNVGVWTNPLKRIIPQFYQDYLKIFIIPSDKTLPLLQYDVCIGSFIFHLENKTFTLLKKRFVSISNSSIKVPHFSLPKKEIAIFAVSFLLSFLLFLAVSQSSNVNFLAKKAPPSPIPLSPTIDIPTATPTPVIDRKELKIKVLNGSGIKGKATEVKDLLTEKGYEEILTGNADNFDYETTEIQIKKNNNYVLSTLKNDLKDNITSPKVTTLAEDEASDIVLIFGKDFK